MAELVGKKTSCEYYPCHFEGQDCTHCFCPFYPCEDTSTGGRWVVSRRSGRRVWSCKYCHWIHRRDAAERVLRELERCGGDRQEARRRAMRSPERGVLMVQGTSSFAGKSLMVMALCRIFSRRGYRVAPFKAQNTSLNSYVTPSGEEVARAQALQAFAARVELEVDMNPILIKPMGESRAQIVLRGRPFRNLEAMSYYSEFALREGIRAVRQSLQRLMERYDAVIIEGAGSPAEINLYGQDIANMRVAELVDAPVILIADIDRGGVFASIYGTVMLLPEKWRRRIRGVVINKFRGDLEILKPGLRQIEKLTGVPVLGVVPYVENLSLPEEDSMALQGGGQGGGHLRLCVVRLPRISNFTDFDPLRHEPGVGVEFVTSPEELEGCDAVIIPGTKNTIADLEWLLERGFGEKLRELAGRVPIFGICGGYQMLGTRIVDEQGTENFRAGEYRGLGLLEMETRFRGMEKVTRRVEGKATEALTGSRVEVRGYEIHMGESSCASPPLLRFDSRTEGAFDEGTKVAGTYLHGIFDAPGFRRAFLRYVSSGGGGGAEPRTETPVEELWDREIDRVADVVERHVDVEYIESLLFKRG
ncbi:MAG: cobyric acid synthase [Euryarchaeota archaeon]|nr:cobyric acid synthase [Euryarchaeota archaeon]